MLCIDLIDAAGKETKLDIGDKIVLRLTYPIKGNGGYLSFSVRRSSNYLTFKKNNLTEVTIRHISDMEKVMNMMVGLLDLSGVRRMHHNYRPRKSHVAIGYIRIEELY